MSTQESKASSTSDAARSDTADGAGANGAVRERRRRWWLGRIEGAPVLRHLSLWWKLVIIVIVLLLPTGLLLRDFVGKSSDEIARMQREQCVESYAQQLRRILSQQIALNGRAGVARPEEPPSGARRALGAAVAELENLNNSGCGVEAGLARLRMAETLAKLRVLVAQVGDDPKGDVNRQLREAVADWFMQLALVAGETEILAPGAAHLDDAILRRLPEAARHIEHMAELGRAPGVEAELTIAARAEMLSAIDGLAMNIADVERDLVEIMQGGVPLLSPRVVPTVRPPFEEWSAAGRKTVRDPAGGAIVTSLRAAAATALDALFATFDNALATRRAELQDKITAREDQRYRTILLVLVAVLAAAGLVSVIVRSITAPINLAVESANSLAAQNFAIEIGETHSTDEVGQLLVSMRKMAANLRATIRSILQASRIVASASEKISTSGEQLGKGAETQSTATGATSASMGQIAEQIQQLSRTATSLSASVEETTTAFQRMYETLERTALHGQTLLASSQEATMYLAGLTSNITQVTAQARTANEMSKATLDSVKSGSEALQRSIGAIGERAQEISKILRLIEEITDQTNLLALNAAIEAALLSP